MPRRKNMSRAMKAAVDFWFKIRNIYTLHILPSEEEALKRNGYDPQNMVCIERFDDESVFLNISLSEPVSIGLKDGGGKLSGMMRLKSEIKELSREQEEIKARIEALEAKRKNSEEE